MTPRLLTRLPGVTDKTHDAVKLTNEYRRHLLDGIEDFEGNITRIRPAKTGPGIQFGQELVGAFHRNDVSHNPLKQRLGLAELPQPLSFEFWFADDRVQLCFTAPTQKRKNNFYSEIDGFYPNSEVLPHDRLLPELDGDFYVAGGYVTLEKSKYFPVRGVEGAHSFETTPLQEVTNALVGGTNERTLLQITFVSASNNWYNGRWNELSANQVARDKRWGRIENHLLGPPHRVDPSDKDERMAEAALGEEGVPAFHVNIRFATFAPTAEQAINRATTIGTKLNTTYHNEAIDQAFERHPWKAHFMDEALWRLASRNWVYNGTTLNKKELGAIVHPPNDNAECNKLDYSRTGGGEGVPSNIPRKSAAKPNLVESLQPTDGQATVDIKRTVTATPATPDHLTIREALEADEEFDTRSDGPVSVKDEKTDFWSLLPWFGGSSEPAEPEDVSDYELMPDAMDRDAFVDAALRWHKGDLTEHQIAAKYDEALAQQLVEAFEEWLEESTTPTADTREPTASSPGSDSQSDEQDTTVKDDSQADLGDYGESNDAERGRPAAETEANEAAQGPTASPVSTAPTTDGTSRDGSDGESKGTEADNSEAGDIFGEAADNSEADDGNEYIVDDDVLWEGDISGEAADDRNGFTPGDDPGWDNFVDDRQETQESESNNDSAESSPSETSGDSQ
jgi:hypothetical protein